MSPNLRHDFAPPRDRRGLWKKGNSAKSLSWLLFQKTPEIYSVELNGSKDIEKADNEGGKERYRGLKNCLELRKHHQKEENKKELDLVSGFLSLNPVGPAKCRPLLKT